MSCRLRLLKVLNYRLEGHTINIPGRVITNGTLAVTLFETADTWVRLWLRDWIRAFETRDQGNSIRSYLGDFAFDTFSNHEAGTPNYSYDILGCYPESYTPGSFEGSNSDAAQWTVNLRYQSSVERGGNDTGAVPPNFSITPGTATTAT